MCTPEMVDSVHQIMCETQTCTPELVIDVPNFDGGMQCMRLSRWTWCTITKCENMVCALGVLDFAIKLGFHCVNYRNPKP